MLRVARRGLAGEHPPAIFAPDAMARLERHLLRTLARTAELALFDELKAFRAAERGGYDAFVRSQLADGLVPLFCDYPVLARQVAVIIGRWVTATAELASRIVIDREALAGTFGDGTDTGLVVDIEPALSDAHHGGRRVAALTFASGLRVVYKPRSLALDAAYGRLLAWVAAQAPPDGVTRADVTRGFAGLALRVLDRGDHGWVEFVEQEACAGLAEVRAYFALAGGLVCLTHVLRGSDLHMENVIATRRGPVLIDLEMLLQPVAKVAAASAPALPSGEPVAPPGGTAATSPAADGESCLTTGFVTMVESNGGEVFDVGGLRGTGAGTAALAGRDLARSRLGRDPLHRRRPPSRPASATPCASTARSRRPTRSPPICWKASTRPTACCWPIARRCSRRTARSPPSPARRSGCCRGRPRSTRRSSISSAGRAIRRTAAAGARRSTR